MSEDKAANTNVWRYDMKQKNMDKETRIRKAQERTDELFPGKDLNDMYEMYLEFFAEYERLWDEGKNVSMEMLEFLNRNKDLIFHRKTSLCGRRAVVCWNFYLQVMNWINAELLLGSILEW